MKLLFFSLFAAAALAQTTQSNLVYNGSFELLGPGGRLEGWASAGNSAVVQQLEAVPVRDGKPSARLTCSAFAGDGPDYHAMLCQVDHVAVRQGQWYKLEFWARAEAIKTQAVEIGLSDTEKWENTGLSQVFLPGPEWRKYDFLFRARRDLAAAHSRLQFWFKSTGTLWLQDVVLRETEDRQEWFPQIATAGVKNFIPNSSFECGTAGWGGFTYGLAGWAGNLYRLEGALDTALARHGATSFKISLSPQTEPVFYFDYYEPVRQPVRRVLAANRGWFRVKTGEPLTLSAWLKADAEATAAQLVVNEAPSRLRHEQVLVGTNWTRCEFTFTPSQPFLFIAVGLDLEACRHDSGILWVDAVQLEKGTHATAYEPRRPVEAFIEASAFGPFSAGQVEPLSVPGNIFTNVAEGIGATIRAFNDTGLERELAGHFAVADFFDQETLSREINLDVAPHSAKVEHLARLSAGKSGWFRLTWSSLSETQSVRCAALAPFGKELADSPFGFNHAYPWDFLVDLARQGGVLWWRDWSAKWQTVEPQKGAWDFHVADQQIGRVLALDSDVEVLLPFPSASWSTSARMDEVLKKAGRNEELKTRLALSFAPRDLNDFGAYAAAVARHYRAAQPRGVTHFQILNEPVYTDYSLFRGFGYGLPDYLRLLQTASAAIHAVDPACRVVGGISAGLDAGFTREFVTQGGLRSVDVFDLHMYDPARAAESFEEPFASLEQLMAAHGGPRPVWITEWGCYADDDPPSRPLSVGDDTMNRCCWPGEREAAEHIVKFAAISFAHGVRKIFFHAGTCGAINQADAAGVLFAYGGAPRKMYAGVSVLTRFLGVPDKFVAQLRSANSRAYVFETGGRLVAIAWSDSGKPRPLSVPASVQAFDIMANRLPGQFELTTTPVFLKSSKLAPLRQAFPAP